MNENKNTTKTHTLLIEKTASLTPGARKTGYPHVEEGN